MSQRANILLDAVSQWQWARLKKLPEVNVLRAFCRDQADQLIQMGVI